MANLQMKKDKNVLSANWEANLLVKDRLSGKLKRLRFQNYDAKLQELLEDDEQKKEKEKQALLNAPEIKLAPMSGHFSPVKLATESAQARAELTFHPEDKQQLESIAQSLPADDSRKYSIEKIVNTLLEKMALSLDADNKQRLVNTLFDFFRNRKRFLNVRELLLTSVLSTRGPLSEKNVDNILSAAKNIKIKIEEAGGLVVKMSELPATPSTPVAKETAPTKPKVDVHPEKVAAFREALESSVPATPAGDHWTLPVTEIKDAIQALSPKSEIKEDDDTAVISKEIAAPAPHQPEPKLTTVARPIVKPEIKTAAPAPTMPNILVKRPEPVNKKTVTDVLPKLDTNLGPANKPRHVLTGPVEELANLTLGNFRRLGENNEERSEKLLEKIKVLEHDSFTKKTQGLEAWRKSPTHQLYLQLGLESMQTAQDVNQLIAKHQQANEETLTSEEFATIADINKKLRFL